MSARILLVEDDPALLTLLQASLAYGGYEEESVGSSREAVEIFKRRKFDAALVDLGLPDGDGADLLPTLRQISDVPILVVSGRGSERDKIDALDRGADDFIAKPFMPGELLARIRAALRRYQSQQVRGETELPPWRDRVRDPISLGPLTIDPFERSIECNQRKTYLSDAEFKVLWTLATSPDGIVSKATILKRLYASDALEDTRIVEVYISNIRKKLRSLHESEMIRNFRGRGWKLMIPEKV